MQARAARLAAGSDNEIMIIRAFENRRASDFANLLR